MGETCDYNSQCSGTIDASLCLHDLIRNKKVCSCVNGYVAVASNCILGTFRLTHYQTKMGSFFKLNKALVDKCIENIIYTAK